MSEAVETDAAPPATPPSIGMQLRNARESKGLTVEQVAAETRIAQRYIEDIEVGQYDELPGRTYAIGFARTIAKVVGLDQNDVAAMVRAEMAHFEGMHEPTQRDFQPGDPTHSPSGGLVWFSVLVLVHLPRPGVRLWPILTRVPSGIS